MEFLDEYESKPRFLFQSKPSLPQPSDSDDALHQSSSSSFFAPRHHKLTISVFVSLFLLISGLTFFYVDGEPLRSLLFWLAFSLLIGPFAPPSLTGGDIRVGLGPPLEEIPDAPTETNDKFKRKTTKSVKKTPEDAVGYDGYSEKSTIVDRSEYLQENRSNRSNGVASTETKSEWGEADEELLRKLMGKHPVGKPGRWEAIAEGFKGKHKVETVITKAKEMGEKKVGDQDSYTKFLKNRKPVDKRVLDEGENEIGNANQNVEEGKESGWSAAEDIALLNALKTFTKDVAMRWEKIAASVPGKTKADCMKRVAELKKDFRSSKGSAAQA